MGGRASAGPQKEKSPAWHRLLLGLYVGAAIGVTYVTGATFSETSPTLSASVRGVVVWIVAGGVVGRMSVLRFRGKLPASINPHARWILAMLGGATVLAIDDLATGSPIMEVLVLPFLAIILGVGAGFGSRDWRARREENESKGT